MIQLNSLQRVINIVGLSQSLIVFQMLSREVKNLHQGLTGQLLPRSGELHTHLKDFLHSQVKDFEEINHRNDSVMDELKKEWDQYNKIVSDVKSKKSKDSKFIEGGAGYLKVKEDEIKAKNKVIESIMSGLRESVSKVVPLKLSQLPSILEEVFSTFYHILYNEPIKSFQWETFKKLALLQDQGEDFITRMANINFKEMSDQNYDCIRVLKTDPKFLDICQNSKFAVDVVDLADWIDYVVEGRKVFLEKKQNQTDFEKIRKDIDRRSDGTLQLKQEFCLQTLKEIDAYQNNLMNLQSQLRTLVIGMKGNLKDLDVVQQKRTSAIERVNSK